MEYEDSLARLMDIAVLTGSRAFNCHRPDSDYDFIITELDADSLNADFVPCCDKLDDDKQEHPDEPQYDYNLYGLDLIDIVRFINSEGLNINLFIFKHNDIYEKFKQVNEYMNNSKLDISNKDIRIQEWIHALEFYEISSLEEPYEEIRGESRFRRG